MSSPPKVLILEDQPADQEELRQANQRLEQAVERKNALNASLERESRTKSILLEAITSILIGIDETDHIAQWNAAAEATFGIPAASVLGKPFVECGIPWNWSHILENIRTFRHANSSTRLPDFRFTRPDGKEGILGITLTPIQLDTNQQPGMLLLGADITQRRLLESQLAHAQKLESIGQLAAGIAHEINTPTQYIGDNTRFLQEAFADLASLLTGTMQLLQACKAGTVSPQLIAEQEAAVAAADVDYLLEEVPKAIQQSLDGIARVSKIVQAMKEFSHPGTEEKVAVDINRAIDSTLTVARNEWKYVADVVTEFDPTLPMVPCLPGDLNQVILNIVINAAHAIADVVGDGSGQKGQIKVSTSQQGPWVEIRIQDTGGGIPKAIRSRVFDPFFTTKEVGKGTGQGLAISHSTVVDKHGGTIHFETEIGKGTTFIIQLPLEEVKQTPFRDREVLKQSEAT
jgi:PAS domain S-box-containing protein